MRSPRFDCFQVHGATSFGFRSNGEALSGRQSVWGGEKDWGFRVNYDVMSGNDYSTGNGSLMPSSYNSQNFSLDFGFDLSPNDRIELRALHLSQRNVEFPGVVTGLNKAVTDGYSLRWTSEENDLADRITFDAWYNDTRFQGDNLRPSYQRQFPQFQDLIPGLGRRVQFQLETEGQTGTWGVREAMTWGRDKEAQVTVGGDFRFITQTINEFDTFLISTVNFPLPRSYSTTPGFFVDGVVPVGEELTVKAGARVDFHQAQLRRPASFPNFGPQEDRLVNHFGTFVGNNFVQNFDVLENQHFDTWAAFTTAEYKLSEQVSAQAGYGFAQRPPTLSELFSVGTFIGLVQPGFSVLDGNPNLEKESMHQVDIGLRGDFENVRGGVTAFYSHVFDFVTYQAFTSNTAGATIRGYRYVNTGQASLVGTEFYTEADLTEWLTPFAVMSYVDGRDISRGEPLPGIPPLDSRVGLRFHEATKAPKWAIEFTTRMVAAQNRVAFALGEPTTGGFNELPTAGFTIFDLRGYWQASEKVLLTAGVENLGDRYYREHLDIRAGLGTYQPGVNAYFGVRVNY